jgi:hypothetical protein
MIAVLCGTTLTIDEIRIKVRRIIPIRMNVELEAAAANVITAVILIIFLVQQLV